MVSCVVITKFVCELSDLMFLQNSRSNRKSEPASTIESFMPPTISMSNMILITMMQLFATVESFAT
jgi:hypothetical protein